MARPGISRRSDPDQFLVSFRPGSAARCAGAAPHPPEQSGRHVLQRDVEVGTERGKIRQGPDQFVIQPLGIGIHQAQAEQAGDLR